MDEGRPKRGCTRRDEREPEQGPPADHLARRETSGDHVEEAVVVERIAHLRRLRQGERSLVRRPGHERPRSGDGHGATPGDPSVMGA